MPGLSASHPGGLNLALRVLSHQINPVPVLAHTVTTRLRSQEQGPPRTPSHNNTFTALLLSSDFPSFRTYFLHIFSPQEMQKLLFGKNSNMWQVVFRPLNEVIFLLTAFLQAEVVTLGTLKSLAALGLSQIVSDTDFPWGRDAWLCCERRPHPLHNIHAVYAASVPISFQPWYPRPQWSMPHLCLNVDSSTFSFKIIVHLELPL